MKKFLFLVAAIGLVAFTSCKTNSDDFKAILDATTPDAIAAEAGEVTFNIITNLEWTIADPAETWLSLDTKTGTGNGAVTVKVEANTGEQRTSDIVISAGELSKTVTIIQEASTAPAGYTIDDLVGTWDASSIYLDTEKNSALVMEYTSEFTKVDETTLTAFNFLNFEKLPYGSNEGEPDNDITIKFDAATQTVSLSVQPMEPSFDPDGWPVYLYPYSEGDFTALYEDNTGFINIPVADLVLDFRTSFDAIQRDGGEPAKGSFVPLTKDPNGTQVYPYGFAFLETVFTKADGR